MMQNNQIDMTQLLQAAMQQRQVQQGNKGLSYCEILSLILVTLKCMGIITCAWFWPFFPLCIPFIVYGIMMLIGFAKMKFIK